MKGMPYLIDGHNLIPKLGLRLDSPDDELELIGILQEFSRLSRRECEVYFDGAPVGQLSTKKFGAVTAHFVRLGTTADSAIIAKLKKLEKAARNWIVVSSDHEVQGAAHSVHAEIASSEEFASQLKEFFQSIGGGPSKGKSTGESELSSDEIEEWLKLFNKKK
jgi:predicted RNA-binding protein with PIN domain